jgi:tRNA isopentenyl-2-thiomethyl-A-37 hydroxylase MiaE
MAVVPKIISNFLNSETPDAWIDEARNRVPELLLDHANCELKAASHARSCDTSSKYVRSCRTWALHLID